VLGIPWDLAEHRLNIDPRDRPVHQKLRRFTLEQKEFIKKQVREVLNVDQIEKIEYPTWVANLVIAAKDGEDYECAWTSQVSTRLALRIPSH
jgi:hypothetical protein